MKGFWKRALSLMLATGLLIGTAVAADDLEKPSYQIIFTFYTVTDGVRNPVPDESRIIVGPVETRLNQVVKSNPPGSVGEYAYAESNPAEHQVICSEPGRLYTIEHVFVRTRETEVPYTVLHLYETITGDEQSIQEDGLTEETGAGMHGETVPVTPVTVYQGNTYELVSNPKPLVLDKRESNTLLLLYQRVQFRLTVSHIFTDGSTHAGYETHTDLLDAGAPYSVEAPAPPEGYELLSAAEATGTVNSDTAVAFTYGPRTAAPPAPGPAPTYRVTVRYREEGTGDALAQPWVSGALTPGSRFDVTEQAGLAVSGYAVSRVEGPVSGTVSGNTTVTVWYRLEEVEIEEPDTPGGALPDEVEPPADDDAALPPPSGGAMDEGGGITEPDGAGGTVIIVEETAPLGNLPQTGTEPEDGAGATGRHRAAGAAFAAALLCAAAALLLRRSGTA